MKISELEYHPKHGVMPEFTKPQRPLEITLNPQPDITAYELSLILPYILKNTPTFPDDINLEEPHFRHLKIINSNQ